MELPTWWEGALQVPLVEERRRGVHWQYSCYREVGRGLGGGGERSRKKVERRVKEEGRDTRGKNSSEIFA